MVRIAFAFLVLAVAGARTSHAECDPTVPVIGSQSLTAALFDERQSAYVRNRIGIMYARGRGVSRNDRLASTIFRQLALDGYTPAMVNLGTLYERGVAGRRNHLRAYAWIRAALALGVPKEEYDATLFKLGMIAQRLGPSRTQGAERLAMRIVDAVGTQCEGSGERYTDTLAANPAH